MDNLLKTCLYDKHVALAAQMSPFAGYMMPIQYTSIVDEHQAMWVCSTYRTWAKYMFRVPTPRNS